MEAEGEPSMRGDGNNGVNDNDDDDAQQLHKYKKHIICILNCNS